MLRTIRLQKMKHFRISLILTAPPGVRRNPIEVKVIVLNEMRLSVTRKNIAVQYRAAGKETKCIVIPLKRSYHTGAYSN
jgi:hypothetical protein